MYKAKRLLNWTKLGNSLIKDDLEKLLSFMSKNKSANAPYHNNQHMMAVALLADRIYLEESSKSEEDYANKCQQRIILFYAASLHDYNHSMGELSDSENIKITNESIKEFFKNPYLYDTVSDIIKITEFPFVAEPFNLVQKCLRDADLLMSLEPDWDEFFEGLKQETGIQITQEENKEWVRSQKFYTPTALRLLIESKE